MIISRKNYKTFSDASTFSLVFIKFLFKSWPCDVLKAKILFAMADEVWLKANFRDFEVRKKLNFFFFAKYSSFLRLVQCADISALDTLNHKSRFILYYNLLSLVYNKRLVVYVPISGFLNSQVSISPIFESAVWLEREVFDMFGIVFLNHPNLTRILTDYGFKGYPLRKDFPLVGYQYLYYSTYNQRIKYLKFG